jgi:hypothetical protein
LSQPPPRKRPGATLFRRLVLESARHADYLNSLAKID